jgi:hypothetical protein
MSGGGWGPHPSECQGRHVHMIRFTLRAAAGADTQTVFSSHGVMWALLAWMLAQCSGLLGTYIRHAALPVCDRHDHRVGG